MIKNNKKTANSEFYSDVVLDQSASRLTQGWVNGTRTESGLVKAYP